MLPNSSHLSARLTTQSTETLLANCSFSHSITGIDTTETTTTAKDPFQYNASGKYTSKQFYGVVIDTGASLRSTAGYGQ